MNYDKTILLINPGCHQGKGWRRWKRCREDVLSKLHPSSTELVIEKDFDFSRHLQPLIDPLRQTLLISAGGDGSLNSLVNFLLHQGSCDTGNITVGAVGLGSSNDFLKPFENKLSGIPVRIERDGGVLWHDVGLARFASANGEEHKRYFIVNASLGLTAEANHRFNHPSAITRFLKRSSTGMAIIYTALTTLVQHRNRSYTYVLNGREMTGPIANINILKQPYVSGSFFYNQQIKRDDGEMSVNICGDLSRKQLALVMNDLQKGRFAAGSGLVSEFTSSFSIRSGNGPVVFECDGETEFAEKINFSILPRAIKVLKY